MQFRPRFTGAAGSPFTATILPSFVATIIPQPVPQKRQTALSHRQPPAGAPGLAAESFLGSVIPTAVAAAAIAVVFTKSLLLIPIIILNACWIMRF